MISKFKEGLFSNSLKPLAFTFVLVLATVFIAEIIGGSNSILGIVSEGHLLTKKTDDFTHVSLELMRSKKLRKLKRREPTVAIFGSSSAREAMSSQEVLATKLPEYNVHKLTSSSQSLAETLIYLDELPNVHEGLVYFGLSFMNFRHSKEEHITEFELPRLSKRSVALAEFLNLKINKLDDIWLNKLITQAFKLKRRYLKGKHFDAIEYNSHMYAGKKEIWSSKYKEFNKKILTDYNEKFYSNKEMNIELLKKIIKLAQEKNYKVVVFDLPLNPHAFEVAEDLVSEYKNIISELKKSIKFKHLPFYWSLGLKREHFYDYSHLAAEGRAIYEKRLFADLIGGGVQ